MPDILSLRFCAIKRRINFFIIAILVFVVGFILGVILILKAAFKIRRIQALKNLLRSLPIPNQMFSALKSSFFLIARLFHV